jgi:hypothetical protein
MKRLVLAAVAAALGWGAQARAQVGGYQRPATSPVYQPAVNPILNANRGAVGYYTQTRPQEDAFHSIGQLQTGVQQLQMQPGAMYTPQGTAANLGMSGHPVAFFNYSHYYQFPMPRYPGAVGGHGLLASPLAPGVVSAPTFGAPPRGPGIGIIVVGSASGTGEEGER